RAFLSIAAVLMLLAVVAGWVLTHPTPPEAVRAPTASNQPGSSNDSPVTTPVRYRGRVDVLVERHNRLQRLNEPGALPLRPSDRFRIEGQVDPPAYLYVVWIDPGHDVTPVYPWDAKVGWGSRPAREEPSGSVSLPANAGNRYTAPDAKSGVATIVLF